MDALTFPTSRTIENHSLPEYSQEEIERAMELYGFAYMKDAIKFLDKLTKDE